MYILIDDTCYMCFQSFTCVCGCMVAATDPASGSGGPSTCGRCGEVPGLESWHAARTCNSVLFMGFLRIFHGIFHYNGIIQYHTWGTPTHHPLFCLGFSMK